MFLGNAKTKEVYKSLQDIRDSLPTGYTIELDGAAEKSVTAVQNLVTPMPIMLFVIMTILMFQLKRIALYVHGFAHSTSRINRRRIGSEYYENTIRLYGYSRYHRPFGYDHP